MALPRILMLSLGGTWAMRPTHGGDTPLAPRRLGEHYDPCALSEFPEIRRFADVVFHELLYLDSTNLIPADWTRTASTIEENHDQYDGFVVASGTDTLDYLAPALAFSLQGIGKPVVLTGAQVSRSQAGSDATSNIVNAFQVAALEADSGGRRVREVVVSFGSRILRATRCRKMSERDLDAFDAINVPVIGHFGTKIRLHGELLPPEKTEKFRPGLQFDKDVALLYLYPGLQPETLLRVAKNASGLVLAAFGAGNIPSDTDAVERGTDLEPAIADIVMRGVPVVVTTKCVFGEAERATYQVGEAAERAHAIVPNDMLPEVAYVKLAWVLQNEPLWPREAQRQTHRRHGRLGGIRLAMVTDMAGEITDNAAMRLVSRRRFSSE